MAAVSPWLVPSGEDLGFKRLLSAPSQPLPCSRALTGSVLSINLINECGNTDTITLAR